MEQIFSFVVNDNSKASIKESMSLLWRLLLSSLLFGGLYVSLSALVLQEVSLWVPVCGLVSLGVCAAFSRMKEKIARMSSLLPLAAAVLMLLFFNQQLLSGLLQMINGVISHWNAMYEDGVALMQIGKSGANDLSIFFLMLSFLLAALSWQLVGKKATATVCGLTVGLLAGSLLLGTANAYAVCMLLLALAGIWTVSICREISIRVVVWFFILMLVLGTVATFFVSKQVSTIDSLREACVMGVDRLRYGEDSLPQGNLYQAPHMLSGQKDTLTITSEQVKSLYLCGFVGDRYQNGIWTELPGASFGGEKTGMLTWLKSQQFLPATQYHTYAALNQETIKNHVTVQNVGAVRKYVYAPYSADNLPRVNWEKTDTPKALGFFGNRDYSFYECAQNLPCELLYASDWVAAPQKEEQQTYRSAEAVYRAFVYDQYTKVPSGVKSVINALFVPKTSDSTASETESVYDVTERIRSVLQENVSYQERFEEFPDDVDPIVYFLTQSHKGNAALYASAAVYAFRACGIPARYAEGYYVTENALRASGGKEVTLTEQNSHAWAEVYFDGLGWLPIDVTPGFYYETYQMQQMVQMPSKIEQTAAPDDNVNQAGNDLSHEEQIDQASKEKGDKISSWIYMTGEIALTILIVLVFLALLIELMRIGACAWLERRMKKMSAEEKTFFLCKSVIYFLKSVGMTVVVGQDLAASTAVLKKIFPHVSTSEYQRVNELIEKYFYGGLVLKPYEMRVLTSFLWDAQHSSKKLSLVAYLRLRYCVFNMCFIKLPKK